MVAVPQGSVAALRERWQSLREQWQSLRDQNGFPAGNMKSCGNHAGISKQKNTYLFIGHFNQISRKKGVLRGQGIPARKWHFLREFPARPIFSRKTLREFCQKSLGK
jgi:hypothetical protein